jgi:hypothetical protein
VPVKSLPATQFHGAEATWGDFRQGMDDTRDHLAQTAMRARPVVVSLDATGRITADLVTAAHLLVDTFSGAASDFLDFIDPTALDDGLWLYLQCFTAARAVGVRHRAASGGGNGEIILIDGSADLDTVVFTRSTQGMWLQRVGGQWCERDRSGFTPAGVIGNPATAPIDLAGNTVRGARPAFVAVGTPTYTPPSSVRGTKVNFAVSCTVALPDPNATGSPWLEEDFWVWDQFGATLNFTLATGGTPTHPANHDRGAGNGARGSCRLRRNPNTLRLEWALDGATGGIVASTGTRRTWSGNASAGADATIPDGQLTNVNLYSMTHSPGSNERWAYIVSYGVFGTSTGSQTNPAEVQCLRSGTTDTLLQSATRGRYSTGRNQVLMGWGNAYGATPGSVTHRIDGKNAVAGHVTTVSAPWIIGLRLEQDEYYVNQGADVTDSTGAAFVDVCSLTQTLPSDDYVVLYFSEFEASGLTAATYRLMVGATAYNTIAVSPEILSGRAARANGLYLPALSGAQTIKLQVQRVGTTGSVTARHSTILLLKKARFQQLNQAADLTETTTSSSTPTAKTTGNFALASGWRTLVLGLCQGQPFVDTSTALADVDFRRNGVSLLPAKARLSARVQQVYAGTAAGYMGVLGPALATDAFDVAVDAGDNLTAMKFMGAQIFALALDTP